MHVQKAARCNIICWTLEREQQKEGMIQAKKSIKLASRDSRVYSACIQDHLGDGVNPNNCDYKKKLQTADKKLNKGPFSRNVFNLKRNLSLEGTQRKHQLRRRLFHRTGNNLQS